MRNYRSSAGPFSERPYYTADEVERICVDSLREVGLYPSEPEPIRIDRFIEKRFKVVPEYEDLGPDVLGMAKFGTNGVQGIVVAKTLDDENSKANERRIRSTLAHEGGHGLLHIHLFAFEADRLLFGENTPSGPVVLCRDISGSQRSSKYSGQWWEFQANMAIGSLLMPRALVTKAIDKYMAPSGQLGLQVIDDRYRRVAINDLAEIFDVNPVVASIRIDEMFPLNRSGQMVL